MIIATVLQETMPSGDRIAYLGTYSRRKSHISAAFFHAEAIGACTLSLSDSTPPLAEDDEAVESGSTAISVWLFGRQTTFCTAADVCSVLIGSGFSRSAELSQILTVRSRPPVASQVEAVEAAPDRGLSFQSSVTPPPMCAATRSTGKDC